MSANMESHFLKRDNYNRRTLRQYGLRTLIGAVLLIAICLGAIEFGYARAARRQRTAIQYLYGLGNRVHISASVRSPAHLFEAILPDYARSKAVAVIDLRDSTFSDKDIPILCEAMGQCHVLESLMLDDTDITDRALEKIATLTSLSNLSLSGTSVSDQAIQSVLRLPNLRTLTLERCTYITDASLPALMRRRRTLHLYISETSISHKHYSILLNPGPSQK
jgi:hypothetical protein